MVFMQYFKLLKIGVMVYMGKSMFMFFGDFLHNDFFESLKIITQK